MYHKKAKKNILMHVILGCIILTITSIISVTLGAAEITITDAFKILLHQLPYCDHYIDITSLPNTSATIIINLRLPRILLSIMVGALLAGSGTVYQSIFRNSMADPFILGISSGAAVGAALAMIMGFKISALGLTSIAISAFIGALFTTFIVYTIANKGRQTSVLSLILTGIAVSYLLSALLSMLITFNRQALERIVFWMYGSFALSSWSEVKIIIPVFFITTGCLIFKGSVLNVMTLGEDSATSLGVDVNKERKILLLITSLATAAAVSVSGIIGFVGLVIPHVIRLISGPDNRLLLPYSMMAGSMFLLLCDAIARTAMMPAEIPIGIITSLIGAPYFIYLILKNRTKAVG